MEEVKGSSSTKAKNKYNAKSYDRFHISVKKGYKVLIEEAAKKENKSLNSYVLEAVDEKLMNSGNPSILDNKEGEQNRN